MSNKRRKTRLVREVERWSKATGLAYSITPGTKHFQVVLMGECIGVLSYGTGSNVDGRNLLAIITKKAKEHADRVGSVQGAGAKRIPGGGNGLPMEVPRAVRQGPRPER